MSGRSDGPPGLAGRLLDLLDREEARGTLRGDLDEEYERHVRPKLGTRAARRWYWRQTLASVPRLLGRRVRGVRFGFRGFNAAGDLRRALRALTRRPGATTAVVLTFALALGANVSVFSVVYGVLLRPLPWADQERVVRVHPDELFYIRLAGAQRFAREVTSFASVVPWGRTLFTFVGDGRGEEVRGGLVQWDHFRMLGVTPELGRGFREEDARSWPYDVVVLSHDLWVRRFGRDPTVVGRRVDINGRMRTVIGVMARSHVPIEADWEAWAPLPLDPEGVAGTALAINARLRPGVSIDQGARDMRRAFRTIWAEDGETTTPDELAGIRLVRLRDYMLGDVTKPLWVLMGGVLAILLLACANVANLLLAQGEGRSGAVAVQLSLGAPPRRVAAQLLAETAFLALGGTALGLWMGWAIVHWASTRLPAALPRATDIGVGLPVIAFGLVAMGIAAVLAGVYPVVRTLRSGLRHNLGAAGRGAAERPGRAASLLVAIESALACVLVVGAALMLQSFRALRHVDPGFEPEGAVAVRVAPPPGRYDEDGARTGLYDRISEEVGAIPTVGSVGGIMFLPMSSGGAWSRYRATATPPESPDDALVASFRVVLPGYFETLRVRRLQGRSFGADDDGEAPRVAIVNETMADRLFPGEDPLGRLVYRGPDAQTAYTVVGVVADVHQADLKEPSYPEIYFPYAQSPLSRMYVVARTHGDAEAVLAAMERAILALDGGIVLSRPGMVADVVGATVADTRILSTLLGLLGLVALLLGAVGIYGVTAHAVSRRRREIGIRMALGAEGGRVALRTVGLGMVPVAVGTLLGVAGAVAGGRVLSGLLFDVAPTDAATLLAVPLVLGGTALIALLVPAVRASTIDPVRTLRDE